MVAGEAVPESLSSLDMSCIRLLFFFACCPDFGLASENGKYHNYSIEGSNAEIYHIIIGQMETMSFKK